MKPPNIKEQNDKYKEHFEKISRFNSLKETVEIAVGGEFDRIGRIEYELLKRFGLKSAHSVVDVGCGSGRLAKEFPIDFNGEYLGTDVVPELLDYARELKSDRNFTFEVVEKLTIPKSESSVDYVCFFSVFTHLFHEQTYKYLLEAKRVLKNNGYIIFSFLEFKIKSHWAVFESNLIEEQTHLNMFIDRDAIQMWADKTGLIISTILDGDRRQVDEYKNLDSLGQSVAVLQNKD